MKKVTVSAIYICLLALAACGGGSTITNPPPAAPPATTQSGAQFGPGGFGTTTVAANTVAQIKIRHRGIFERLANAIDPAVDAATTATISGSYSGECPSLQNVTGFVPLYGIGNPSPTCNFYWGSGTAFPSGPGNGLPAIGSGTLSTLVAYGLGTNVLASSGTVTVFVNGSATALTCNIGQGDHCEDTADSVSVSDGDTVAIAVQVGAGEQWTGLQAIVLKQ